MRTSTAHPHLAHVDYRFKSQRYWDRLVFWSFFVSLILFCRAFLPCGHDCHHLAPPSLSPFAHANQDTKFILETQRVESGDGDSVSRKSTEENGMPFDLLREDPLWNPAGTANTTSEFEINYTSSQHHLDQPPADGTTKSLTPLGASIHKSSTSGAASGHDVSPYDVPQHVVSSAQTRDYAISVYSTHTDARVFDPGYDPLEPEPFFAMEEFDDEGQTFALKIWIDKDKLLRGQVGKVEVCQASGGVKCLPDIP